MVFLTVPSSSPHVEMTAPTDLHSRLKNGSPAWAQKLSGNYHIVKVLPSSVSVADLNALRNEEHIKNHQ